MLPRMGIFSKKGLYEGRLAFDPETLFHLAADGLRVVTDDAGRTWRYATKQDQNHNARYHKGEALVVLPTTNEGFLAGDPAHAHHADVTPASDHPDGVAPTLTSHTDAWKAE